MIKLFLGLVLVGMVVCFDFEDVEHDKLLMEDNISVHKSASLLMNVPALVGPKANTCCDDGAVRNKIYEKFLENKKDCFSEVRRLKTLEAREVEDVKGDISCAMQCIGRKHEVADVNGNIIVEKIFPAVEAYIVAAEWQKPVLKTLFETCVAEVGEKHTTGSCNPAMSKFEYCMWRQFVLACPIEKQENSVKCTELREKLSKNEYAPLHYSYPDQDE